MLNVLNRKPEVMSVNDFMNGNYGNNKRKKEWEVKKQKTFYHVGAALGLVTMPSVVGAESTKAMVTEKIVNAFEPVVDLAQGMSYPLALLMMIGGGLFILIGNKEKGFQMIQQAGLGYIVVQLMPLIMGLLVEITKAM